MGPKSYGHYKKSLFNSNDGYLKTGNKKKYWRDEVFEKYLINRFETWLKNQNYLREDLLWTVIEATRDENTMGSRFLGVSSIVYAVILGLIALVSQPIWAHIIDRSPLIDKLLWFSQCLILDYRYRLPLILLLVSLLIPCWMFLNSLIFRRKQQDAFIQVLHSIRFNIISK